MVRLVLAAGLSLLAVAPAAAAGKGVTVDTRSGRITVNGKVLPNLELATLKRVLGAPSRVKTTVDRERFERFPGPLGGSPHSTMVDVKNHHYVYDRLGLLFHTRNGRYDNNRDPATMIVVLRHKIAFTHRRRPRFFPRRACRALAINGVQLNRDGRLVPKGVTYRTEKVRLFNTDFAPTSYTTDIDSVYAHGEKRAIRIFLDNPRDGRPAYVVID
jgi:hypothetical protein